MTQLPGRAALITGGATGFGFAAARALKTAGANVAICGRRSAKLAAAAVELLHDGIPGEVFSATADVRDPASVSRLVHAVRERFGRIDILVNNAAVLYRGRLDELTPPQLAESVATNLLGPLLTTQAVLPLMKAQNYGRIINITSGLGWKPIPGQIPYSATKAGLNAATRTLSAELGCRWDILVNAMDPGVARTELNPAAGDSPEKIAPGLLRLATLPAGGPSGHVFTKDGITIATGA
jgi:3-oxoacyl-[acyl-carrier protein] reductase